MSLVVVKHEGKICVLDVAQGSVFDTAYVPTASVIPELLMLNAMSKKGLVKLMKQSGYLIMRKGKALNKADYINHFMTNWADWMRDVAVHHKASHYYIGEELMSVEDVAVSVASESDDIVKTDEDPTSEDEPESETDVSDAHVDVKQDDWMGKTFEAMSADKSGNTKMLVLNFFTSGKNGIVNFRYNGASKGEEVYALLKTVGIFMDGLLLNIENGSSYIYPNDTIASFCLDDVCNIYLRPKISGGGKRGYGDIGCKTTTADRKKQLVEELNMFYIKCQLTQSPLSNDIMAVVNQVKTSIDTVPHTVGTNMFNALNKEFLKEIATLCNVSNTDKKMIAIAKVVFADKFANIQAMSKMCHECERVLKSVLNLVLLSEFSSEDAMGVSWGSVSAKLMDIMAIRGAMADDL